MREHSGHKNSNNDRNPTLKDAEKAKDRSGEAELKTAKGPHKNPGPR